MRVVFLRVDDDLHRLVRVVAANENRTIGEVGEDALRDYVEESLNIKATEHFGYDVRAVRRPADNPSGDA